MIKIKTKSKQKPNNLVVALTFTLLNSRIPVTREVSSASCLSLSLRSRARNVPNSVAGKMEFSAAVASLTTAMSVGDPRPDRSKTCVHAYLFHIVWLFLSKS